MKSLILQTKDKLKSGIAREGHVNTENYHGFNSQAESISNFYSNQSDCNLDGRLRGCNNVRKSTVNILNERDSSGSQSDRHEPCNSHSNSAQEVQRTDTLRYSRNKEIDASTFEKDINTKRLQLIEKLEISRCDSRDNFNDDNEYFDTHIVNGFDDSVRQEGLSGEVSSMGKYDGFSVMDIKKSRNIQGLQRKLKPKGIKTMASMKENISENRGVNNDNWGKKTVDGIESSFAMNQNHLHLHVNVTNNTEFGTMDKISHMSRLSDHDLSRMNMSSIRANEVNCLKACNNEKLKLKKNNIQYTPLTINGILRDNIKPPPKDRLKTKSNDMESMSLSNSSCSKRIYIGGSNSQTLNTTNTTQRQGTVIEKCK